VKEFRKVLGWPAGQPARLFFSYAGPSLASTFFIQSSSGAVGQISNAIPTTEMVKPLTCLLDAKNEDLSELACIPEFELEQCGVASSETITKYSP
tara:strand:- start:830 stop:1114 length:285 start_codon:yes stop_codon:yes gene_type:complete